MKINTIKATFVREEKNRFQGIITIDGKECECYIPCSSKLINYFDANNKPALVIPIDNEKSRLKYRLIAVRVGDEWVVVDLNILNSILKEKYEREGFLVKQEQKIINGYRTDLVAEKEGFIRAIEIKGIISLDSEVLVPFNSGERANRQLVLIKKILYEHIYEVEYAFVLLSKQIRKIKINDKYAEYKKIFGECVKSGMVIKTYRVDLKKDEITINEDVEIELER